MRAATMSSRNHGLAEIVKANELIGIRVARGRVLGLAARRALNLMIQAAAGNAWKDQWHEIPKKLLRQGHKSNDRLTDLLDELGTTQIIVEGVNHRNKPGLLIIPLLAARFEEHDETDAGMVQYAFTPEVRDLLRASDTYAALSGRAILAFDSRYALILYEIGCQLCGRRDPTVEYTVPQLRDVLNIPRGKLSGWADLRRKALEAAKAELDQLAHFTLTWTERRQGRKVMAAKLSFWPKRGPDAIVAAEEADRHRAGRRARRQGMVEAMTTPDQTGPAAMRQAVSSNLGNGVSGTADQPDDDQWET
jgi:hypothetical protein